MLEATLNARVTQRTEVSPGLLILRVAPAGWALPEFTPGQFSVLALPGLAKRCEGAEAEPQAPDPQKLIRRAYSIASSSIERSFWNSTFRWCVLAPLRQDCSRWNLGIAYGCRKGPRECSH